MSFERRIFIALLLCALVWIGFDWFAPKPPPPPEEDAQGEDAQADTQDGEVAGEPKDAGAKDDAVDPAAPPADGPEAAKKDATPVAEDVEVVHHEIANDLLSLKVTNRAPGQGGMVEEVDLLSEQFQGHSTATDPLDLGGASTLEVSFADAQSDFRIPGGQSFVVDNASSDSFTLVHRTDEVQVKQTLKLLEGYEGLLTVEVSNLGAQAQRHVMHLRSRVGITGEESRYNLRRGMCRTAEDYEYEDSNDVEDGPISYGTDPIHWGGIDNKYFGTLLVPSEAFAACEIGRSDDGSFLVNSLASDVATLGPGEVKRYEVGLFIGAKELERLQDFSAVKPATEVHLEEAIDWGILGGLSEYLGRMLLALMRFFYSYVGIWGWAIVLVTIVIKVATLPLTLKQMNSMKAMKRIQPKIAALKEKYGDDRVKQGQEMQALFAREGVNPLAGCLPVFVQMPVYIALYAMLGAAVELVHEPFIWLPDLTKQDPYYALPLMLGGMMILQQRMMPSTGDEMQAKMMRWIMPVVFSAFMLFLPSGLALYIFVNICLSVVQTAIQVGRNTDEPKADGDAAPSGAKSEGKSAKKPAKKK